MTLFTKLYIVIATVLMGWLLYLINERGDKISQLISENTKLQITLQERKTTTEEVVSRPDGTVTVKRQIVENKTKVLEKVAEKKVETKATGLTSRKEVGNVDSKLSFGISYNSAHYSSSSLVKDYLSLPSIEGGYRLGGSNVWITVGHDFYDHSYSAGVRIEF